MKLKINNIGLPSNKKFGLFFSSIFLWVALYLFIKASIVTSLASLILSFSFLIVALFKDDLLLPLNKLWMRLGFFLGIIISPIVLGIVFFAILTPIAFIIKVIGRDELKLKDLDTYWIDRKHRKILPESFKQQF
ncbi:MAG: hypothetical protein CBC38_07920 [Gammaproteobacteria bacterium TMED78]|nr:MAG: hypothetical protein CBC38_07920 [Gammaproteobacteria bacterium TMED78]|tara:strand:- start:3638 stop:4039 length:402 start_codon:yes stop_codon:yes gene_type:complete